MLLDTASVFLRLSEAHLSVSGAGGGGRGLGLELELRGGNLVKGGNYEIWWRGRQAF